MTQTVITNEKLNQLQQEMIRKQEREINELRESKRILEAVNQTLAEALARALSREGRDRVFVPIKEIKPTGASFRVERTIDGDVLLIRA